MRAALQLTLSAAVLFALVLLVPAAEARKCRRENRLTKCLSKGATCGGVAVDGLCGVGQTCCIPGSSTRCTEISGTCMRHSKCASGSQQVPGRCPGTSQVTCCVPQDKELPNVEDDELQALQQKEAHPVQNVRETHVKNKISDITDFLLNNITSATPSAVKGDFCWPVARDSNVKETMTRVSFGSSRWNGRRCHAGINIFTKAPGVVQTVDEGQVIAVVDNFTTCHRGWGVPKHERHEPHSVSAVFVFHANLGQTINYAELDPQRLLVHEGQTLKRGEAIGVASLCGMMSFEVYHKYHQHPTPWMVPESAPPLNEYENCANMYMQSKPKALADPRPLLKALEGKFC